MTTNKMYVVCKDRSGGDYYSDYVPIKGFPTEELAGKYIMEEKERLRPLVEYKDTLQNYIEKDEYLWKAIDKHTPIWNEMVDAKALEITEGKYNRVELRDFPESVDIFEIYEIPYIIY